MPVRSIISGVFKPITSPLGWGAFPPVLVCADFQVHLGVFLPESISAALCLVPLTMPDGPLDMLGRTEVDKPWMGMNDNGACLIIHKILMIMFRNQLRVCKHFQNLHQHQVCLNWSASDLWQALLQNERVSGRHTSMHMRIFIELLACMQVCFLMALNSSSWCWRSSSVSGAWCAWSQCL